MDNAQRLQMANLPTPIMRTQRFFNDLSDYEVFIKRDDFTGLELSGNKVRKLNYLFNEALRQGSKRVMTCGGVQSNHCRATAFYATKLGLKTSLFLRGSAPEQWTGNLLLNKLLGAEIHFITAEEYKTVNERMADYATELSDPAYIIPEGGSNEIGAWGYVDAFREIIDQDAGFDTIVVPSGSGGTHAGLLLGKLLNKHAVNVYSVNVCDDETFFVNKIDTIMHRFCDRYKADLHWDRSDIHVLDGFVGRGYALIGQSEADLITRFARVEGIIIDPVYGAKTLLGLRYHLQQGTIPGKRILYIHTGGVFGLFPFHEMF